MMTKQNIILYDLPIDTLEHAATFLSEDDVLNFIIVLAKRRNLFLTKSLFFADSYLPLNIHFLKINEYSTSLITHQNLLGILRRREEAETQLQRLENTQKKIKHSALILSAPLVPLGFIHPGFVVVYALVAGGAVGIRLIMLHSSISEAKRRVFSAREVIQKYKEMPYEITNDAKIDYLESNSRYEANLQNYAQLVTLAYKRQKLRITQEDKEVDELHRSSDIERSNNARPPRETKQQSTFLDFNNAKQLLLLDCLQLHIKQKQVPAQLIEMLDELLQDEKMRLGPRFCYLLNRTQAKYLILVEQTRKAQSLDALKKIKQDFVNLRMGIDADFSKATQLLNDNLNNKLPRATLSSYAKDSPRLREMLETMERKSEALKKWKEKNLKKPSSFTILDAILIGGGAGLGVLMGATIAGSIALGYGIPLIILGFVAGYFYSKHKNRAHSLRFDKEYLKKSAAQALENEKEAFKVKVNQSQYELDKKIKLFQDRSDRICSLGCKHSDNSHPHFKVFDVQETRKISYPIKPSTSQVSHPSLIGVVQSSTGVSHPSVAGMTQSSANVSCSSVTGIVPSSAVQSRRLIVSPNPEISTVLVSGVSPLPSRLNFISLCGEGKISDNKITSSQVAEEKLTLENLKIFLNTFISTETSASSKFFMVICDFTSSLKILLNNAADKSLDILLKELRDLLIEYRDKNKANSEIMTKITFLQNQFGLEEGLLRKVNNNELFTINVLSAGILQRCKKMGIISSVNSEEYGTVESDEMRNRN